MPEDELSTHTIHRFWAGKPMPDEYELFGQMWWEQNVGWEVFTWNESHIPEFMERYPHIKPVIDSLYERDGGRHGIELYVQLADVMGYLIVHRFGGIYVNCDMQPVQSLADRLPDLAWASLENNEDGRIVNAAIGAPEDGDRFWGGLIEALPERYFANPTDEMVMTTGPGFLTDYVHEYLRSGRGAFYVFPVETFNPVHWKQVEQGGDASAWADNTDWRGTGTIAVHHWGHKKDHRTNTVENATQYHA